MQSNEYTFIGQSQHLPDHLIPEMPLMPLNEQCAAREALYVLYVPVRRFQSYFEASSY